MGQGDHVAREGECIASIARSTGHFWETIWNDAGNSELRRARQGPNVLLPADRVAIPEKERKDEAIAPEMRHRFVRRGEPAFLRIRVLDNDRPLANQPYDLRVDDQTLSGTTDPEGKLDVPIPGNAHQALLSVGTEPNVLRYALELGGTDPVDAMRGVQQRLRNLGFRTVEITGAADEKTAAALREFQKLNQLPETGQADDGTRQKLRQKHGS